MDFNKITTPCDYFTKDRLQLNILRQTSHYCPSLLRRLLRTRCDFFRFIVILTTTFFAFVCLWCFHLWPHKCLAKSYTLKYMFTKCCNDVILNKPVKQLEMRPMQQYIVVMSMDIGCKGQKTLALVTIASLGGMSHSWGKLSVTHLLNYNYHYHNYYYYHNIWKDTSKDSLRKWECRNNLL